LSVPAPTIGASLGPTILEYAENEVILYALGVGATTDQLSFVYERDLRVVPSFATLAAGISKAWLEGWGFDLTRVFHGEHLLSLHLPIPVSGRLETVTEVTELRERAAGTFVRFVSRTVDSDGSPVCDNECLFIEVPEVVPYRPKRLDTENRREDDHRPTDFEASFAIGASQAALYRLSGDDNPLHIDHDFARSAGFDRPLLHGLCTFGYATRAVIAHACGADPDRLREIGVRFAAPVFPGDSLTVSGRRDDETYISFEAHTENGAVLTHGRAELQIAD
jgi:acyl dehydratase